MYGVPQGGGGLQRGGYGGMDGGVHLDRGGDGGGGYGGVYGGGGGYARAAAVSSSSSGGVGGAHGAGSDRDSRGGYKGRASGDISNLPLRGGGSGEWSDAGDLVSGMVAPPSGAAVAGRGWSHMADSSFMHHVAESGGNLDPNAQQHLHLPIDVNAIIAGVETRTTIMIRHIPSRYTQAQLIDEINKTGFGDLCDFVYQPVDFRNGCSCV
jgi:hypothetical protein